MTSVVASGAPYALSFSARVASPRQVAKVDSECRLEPLRYLDKEQTSALVRPSVRPTAAKHISGRGVPFAGLARI